MSNICMMTLTTTLPILVLLSFGRSGVSSEFIDSDSDYYSDEIYHELQAEYLSDLTQTTGASTTSVEKPYPQDDGGFNKIEFPDDQEEVDSSADNTEGSYKEAIIRLQCDNPWFWNTFKCLWLDVQKKNYLHRTRTNGITVAWILGPLFVVLMVLLCGSCIVTWYVKSRVEKLNQKIEDMRLKYEPGSITLDDGTVRKYSPTEEEIDAFENLISTLVSIV